jgi:hypothetical protein
VVDDGAGQVRGNGLVGDEAPVEERCGEQIDDEFRVDQGYSRS